MNTWADQLLYALLPGVCVVCEAPSHRCLDLCVRCENELPRAQHACPRCALPLPYEQTCGGCQTDPPPFRYCHAAFIYQTPVDRLITAFKDSAMLPEGKVLGTLLARHYVTAIARNQISPPHLLVPVPLHKNKLKLRGFNQSAVLAQHVADASGVRVDGNVCQRVRHGDDQKRSSKRARQTNMVDAFRVTGNLDGLTIGLVDDVVTSQATVRAIAGLMKIAGARYVDVICLARTPTSRRPPPARLW